MAALPAVEIFLNYVMKKVFDKIKILSWILKPLTEEKKLQHLQ